MTFSEKIDEWIKEAETRPGSALMILKFVAGRMRDLTERNEEILAENISLQDGSRVLEYQKRIAYLEFQLDLLKRQLGNQENGILASQPEKTVEISLLIYNAHGRIARFQLESSGLTGGFSFGQLTGELHIDGEFPRLLALRSSEEVLLLNSSGRISTHPVNSFPILDAQKAWSWEDAHLPDEPHAGEILVSVLPLSHLPVCEFFLQVSRRGCVKKTMKSISEQILANHYLGRGTVQKNDIPFDVCLSDKKVRYVIVTYEGKVLTLDANDLSFAAEERIRLNATDHIVAAFVLAADETLMCVTQNGKILQKAAASLETAKSPAARGQALISQNRLDQGARFIGALPFHETDILAALDGKGNTRVFLAKNVCGAGSLPDAGVFVSIGLIPSNLGGGKRA